MAGRMCDLLYHLFPWSNLGWKRQCMHKEAKRKMFFAKASVWEIGQLQSVNNNITHLSFTLLLQIKTDFSLCSENEQLLLYCSYLMSY